MRKRVVLSPAILAEKGLEFDHDFWPVVVQFATVTLRYSEGSG